MQAKVFSVSVCEPADLDLEVFSLWLSGCDVRDAARRRLASEPAVTKQFRDFQALLESEVRDQYRLFQILEPYLQSPQTLLTQPLFQLSSANKRALLECYYTFNEEVVREFLGKKLSSKNRKDLDNVSEKTGITLKSCRRQFDNIKRILRVVDDFEGTPLVQNIIDQFLLPEELARSYASVVFISHNRFETNKKKLSHLTFSDFTYCARQMINHWTEGSEGSHAADDDLELDRHFLQELHDLKLSMLDRVWVDRHQKLVLKDMRKKKYPANYIKSVEQNFWTLSKAIISLGASLLHSKDLKDFFVDLVDNIVEPCIQLHWEKNELDTFLGSMKATFVECEIAHSKQTGRPNLKDRPWRVVYLRYFDTLKDCLLTVYR